MDLVARAQAKRGLNVGGMESALRVEFRSHLEFLRELMSNDQAQQPAVRAVVDKLITDLGIHTHRAIFLANSKGNRKVSVGGVMPRATALLGLLTKSCGKTEMERPDSPGIVKAPLDSWVGLTETEDSSGSRMLDPQPRIFIGELNAIAYTEIDVDIRDVRDRLIAIEKRHVA